MGTKSSPGLTAILLLVALIVIAIGSTACGQGTPDTTAPGSSETAGPTTTSEVAESTTTSAEDTVYTLEELTKFDGQNGNAAYVAVDGVVYDVSDSRLWPEGVHGSCSLGASAGGDLSELIQKAPASMRALLEKMPVVGRLAP